MTNTTAQIGNVVRFTDELGTPMHGLIIDKVENTFIVEDNDGDISRQNNDRAKTQEKPNLAREENIRAIREDIEKGFEPDFEDFNY